MRPLPLRRHNKASVLRGTVQISHNRYEGSIDQPYQYVGQLGYYTHYMDPEFKLLQLGVRFHDSGIGRFTQRDPIQDGLNWYGYCEASPTGYVDPSGMTVGSLIVRIPGFGRTNSREVDADIAAVGYTATYCAMKARDEAIGLVQKVYGPKRPWIDSWENAIMHCTLTCIMAAKCGRSTAVQVTNNHEKFNWNSKTGPMDLANNAEGLFVWCKAPPLNPSKKRNQGNECLKGCTKRVYSGHWWLPARTPVPSYTGGNR